MKVFPSSHHPDNSPAVLINGFCGDTIPLQVVFRVLHRIAFILHASHKKRMPFEHPFPKIRSIKIIYLTVIVYRLFAYRPYEAYRSVGKTALMEGLSQTY